MKARYTVFIEWDAEEELFIATMPALSVASYGETEEEALEKVREAAEVTIEGLKDTGQPVPAEDDGMVRSVELAV